MDSYFRTAPYPAHVVREFAMHAVKACGEGDARSADQFTARWLGALNRVTPFEALALVIDAEERITNSTRPSEDTLFSRAVAAKFFELAPKGA